MEYYRLKYYSYADKFIYLVSCFRRNPFTHILINKYQYHEFTLLLTVDKERLK